MKRKKALKLSFDYMDTPERRVLSLVPDGVPCVPVLGFDAYRCQWRVAPIHVHEECLEISLCLRGDLEFELGGMVPRIDALALVWLVADIAAARRREQRRHRQRTCKGNW